MKRFLHHCLVLLCIINCIDHYVSAQTIDDIEYFIDTDPGVGNGTRVTPTVPGTSITESLVIPTSTLSEGFHTIYIRIHEADSNRWSMSESRSFYISASDLTTQADVVAMEYFIDIDPGYGSGTSLPLTTGSSVNLSPTIPTAALSTGFHTIYIRAQDSDNIWGDVESRSFYISPSDLTTQASIVAAEYYIDTDPGYGSGTSLPITVGTTIDESITITTSTLSAGHHVLYIRTQDSDGIWGEMESRSFYVDAFTPGLLSGFEYFIDIDPGYGNALLENIAPPKDSIDSVVTIPTAALATGPHILGIRMLSDNGSYGLTDYFNITVCETGIAALSSTTVCTGNATNFTDLSSNILAGDVFSWDFDNDGLEDSNTQGNQSFTYLSEGVYTAKLSIDRVGCISTDSIQVNVEAAPVADAGMDQDICITSTVLASSDTIGVNETGLWTIFSGSATIVDTADPISAISGISTDSVELIWTKTNTLGGCSDSDTVLITANLPITALTLEDTVDIGQLINFDVQSGALVNLGDILTTSIITMPLYGIADLLADGTIDYIPDPDALSHDTITYRITNQCNNYDEDQILIAVANQPPVIVPANVTFTSGSVEATLDLTTIISDPNDNIDFASISVITQPASGAMASIVDGLLVIDYSGISFAGTDQLEVQVCDLLGVCTIEIITLPNVEVGGDNPPISVFNAVSPNGDGYHDFLEIENIEFYPNNLVIIINRWGVEIDRIQGYNNQDIVFNRSELPSGTYYYHILPNVDGVEDVTGHFILKIE